MDQLIERIHALNSPIVVGLDPTPEMIPDALSSEVYGTFGRTPAALAEMFFRFNCAIIDSIADIVPAVKPQIAMYERFGSVGIAAYERTTAYARSRGLYVIGDVKRGDISSTAEAYAAHLSGVTIDGVSYDSWKEDAITVNPYLGTDGIVPFTKAAKEADKAIFVLVKTSNPSSRELQDLTVCGSERGASIAADGNCAGAYAENDEDSAVAETGGVRTLYRTVGALVEQWGSDSIGKYGYSRVGAVVGATHKEIGTELRRFLPHTFFLVPGYGAQGATAEDLKGFFDKDGRGCIVNSSRGIIAAWKKTPELSVGEAARAATLRMREELRSLNV